ncbi:MAG: hypothetical protein AABP62_31535 [Planctomycetota bacterium]
MTTTAINITHVDNELYIVATPSSARASSELFHYMSGFGANMNVVIVPQHVLPPGKYTLSFIGINWGGPAKFTITMTTNGVTTPVPATAGSTVGVVWTANMAITV